MPWFPDSESGLFADEPPPPSLDVVDALADDYWPIERIRRCVAETLGGDDGDVFEAGVFLLTGALIGGLRTGFIRTVTRQKPKPCQRFFAHARAAGIGGRDWIDFEPWTRDDPPGVGCLNFSLDAMLCAGQLRAFGPRGPEQTYSLPSERRIK